MGKGCRVEAVLAGRVFCQRCRIGAGTVGVVKPALCEAQTKLPSILIFWCV